MKVIGSSFRLMPPSSLQAVIACKQEIFARLLSLRAQGVLRGAILLGTCNRLEIILDLPAAQEPRTQDASASSAVEANAELRARILGEHTASPLHEIQGKAATQYILRVATGLESMVRGEEQILGQFREAFKQAENHELLSPALHVLRSQLLATARDIRQRTGLTQSKVSVASLAAKQLLRAGRRLVVLGAGETGRLAVETLVKHSGIELLIVNRSYQRAAGLAQHHGAQAMSLSDFLTKLDAARDAKPESRELQWDGILCAIDSREALLSKARASSFKMLVDVSMPSVLKPEVHQLDRSEVLDLDAIARLVDAESARRSQKLKVAAELVKARAQGLHRAMQDAGAGTCQHLGQILEMHLQSAMGELDSAFASKLRHLSAADQDKIRQTLVRSVKHSAHLHIKDLRELARS